MFFSQPWEKFLSPVSVTSEWNKKNEKLIRAMNQSHWGATGLCRTQLWIAISVRNPAWGSDTCYETWCQMKIRWAGWTIFCCPLQGSVQDCHLLLKPGKWWIGSQNNLCFFRGTFKIYLCIVISTVICTQLIFINIAFINNNYLSW